MVRLLRHLLRAVKLLMDLQIFKIHNTNICIYYIYKYTSNIFHLVSGGMTSKAWSLRLEPMQPERVECRFARCLPFLQLDSETQNMEILWDRFKPGNLQTNNRFLTSLRFARFASRPLWSLRHPSRPGKGQRLWWSCEAKEDHIPGPKKFRIFQRVVSNDLLSFCLEL